ncbi:MAG: TPM domain-containing protein [Candidatus Margulisiibacteriota bacterium]
MRLFLAGLTCLLLLSISSAQKVELIKEQGVVSDYAEVVDAYTRDKVEKLAGELKRITSVKYRVVVIRSVEMMEVIDAQAYGQQLYDRWDVGQAKDGLEHGVLLLVSIVDRQVKIILGRQVDKLFTQEEKEQMEWSVMAELAEGKFSQGVEVGSGLIIQQILAHWPTKGAWFGGLNWEKASFPLFLLVLVAIALTLVTGGGFLMGFSIAVGGLFGYMFLGVPGMALAAALGFFLNFSKRTN